MLYLGGFDSHLVLVCPHTLRSLFDRFLGYVCCCKIEFPFIGNLCKHCNSLHVSVMTCFCQHNILVITTSVVIIPTCSPIVGGILKLGGLFELIWVLHGLRIQCRLMVNLSLWLWRTLLGASSRNMGGVLFPCMG